MTSDQDETTTDRTEDATHDAAIGDQDAPVIRAATQDDAETVERALLYPFYRAIEAIDPALNELAIDGPEDADCTQWLDDDDRALFVAEVDERLVGFVSAEVVEPPSLYARERLANVGELYVRPAYRRRGIATQLLDYVEAWAGDEGCEHVGITAHADNEAARGLYEDRYGCTFRRYLSRLD